MEEQGQGTFRFFREDLMAARPFVMSEDKYLLSSVITTGRGRKENRGIIGNTLIPPMPLSRRLIPIIHGLVPTIVASLYVNETS